MVTVSSAPLLADRRGWAASTKPLDWANENLAVANTPSTEYIVREEQFDFGEDFERRELPVAYDRLSRVGVRLGALLNGAFGH